MSVRKRPQVMTDKPPVNQGDDISGYVHEVGENVSEFKPGDRVIAFHEMMKPGGSYAEYALSWAHTTAHLPAKISFQGRPHAIFHQSPINFFDRRRSHSPPSPHRRNRPFRPPAPPRALAPSNETDTPLNLRRRLSCWLLHHPTRPKSEHPPSNLRSRQRHPPCREAYLPGQGRHNNRLPTGRRSCKKRF